MMRRFSGNFSFIVQWPIVKKIYNPKYRQNCNQVDNFDSEETAAAVDAVCAKCFHLDCDQLLKGP